MSRYAHVFVYEMRLQRRNIKIQGKAKSSSNVWKYGHVIISSNQTSKQNWELLQYRNTENKLIALVLMIIATFVGLFWSNEFFFLFCPCQEAIPSLSDDDIKRVTRNKEMDELQKYYIREKGTSRKRCNFSLINFFYKVVALIKKTFRIINIGKTGRQHFFSRNWPSYHLKIWNI